MLPEKIETGYELVVIKGEDRGRVFPLQYREMHIGRKSHPAAADVEWVFLMDATVSRHHASVIWDEGRHRYILHHRSRTNPTLVNGHSVQQVPLEVNDTVQLGMLTFKVGQVSIKRTPMAPPPSLPGATRLDDQNRIDTGFSLSVVDGPDRGATYKLDQTICIVGRTSGEDDHRSGQAILLNDPLLPYEQIMLTWHDRERTYGVLQIDRSNVPTVVSRESPEGHEQVVLDSIHQILLQSDDHIRLGHTTMLLQGRKVTRDSLRDSAERHAVPVAPVVEPGRMGAMAGMAPMAGLAPMAGPILPTAPGELPPPVHAPPVSLPLSGEARPAPPRLPAPPQLGDDVPDASAERVPPRFPPPLGTRRTEPIDNSALKEMLGQAGPAGPPTGPPRPPSPTEMLANRSWPRLSGESAAAAKGMANDPYPAAYAGWPPPPVEVAGGPTPWAGDPTPPGAWAPGYDSGSRRNNAPPEAAWQGAAPRAPGFSAPGMPTPGWAEPGAPASTPDMEHEFKEGPTPEQAFDAPEVPSPVLRRQVPGLWTRAPVRTGKSEPPPSVVPVKRAAADEPAPEEPPREVRKREPEARRRPAAADPAPPPRPSRPAFRNHEEEPHPVFESFEDEPPPPERPLKAASVFESFEEPAPPPRPRKTAQVFESFEDEPRPAPQVFESFEDEPPPAERWEDPAARARPLPWGKSTGGRKAEKPPTEKLGRKKKGDTEEQLARSKNLSPRSRQLLGAAGESAQAAAVKTPRIIGEPARPPAPPRKELLGEDFGARVVQPPSRDDEPGGARPMESWSPGSAQDPRRNSGIVKKSGTGQRPLSSRPAPAGEPAPRPMNIIGLGGTRGGGGARPGSAVRYDDSDHEDEDSLTSTRHGWRFQADFVLGFLEGPQQGNKIELLTHDLEEGHEISLGRRGARNNDIEIEDEKVANEQAILRYHDNRFSLSNQSRTRQIQVNKLVLGQDEEILLKHGDRIGMGQTRLIFLERATVEALFGYELAILSGIPQDQGRRFDIIKERTSIGRGADVDVSPNDEGVSRRHAVIEYREGAFYLTHESVSSPTFVNGVSLPKGRERKLNLGDKIQISKATTLVFRAKA